MLIICCKPLLRKILIVYYLNKLNDCVLCEMNDLTPLFFKITFFSILSFNSKKKYIEAFTIFNNFHLLCVKQLFQVYFQEISVIKFGGLSTNRLCI